MTRRLCSALLLTAVGAGALTAAPFANQGTRRSVVVRKGGTLHVNISNTDVTSLDPTLDYEFVGWQILYATAAKLLNYPDRPGKAGARLVPEVATRLPKISRDGKTYTFTIRPGFRFSTGAPVTAASFAFAINRALSPAMASPGAAFVRDIVGAPAVVAGRARRAQGVRVRGNRLTIHLVRPVPDFVSRIELPFFSALPTSLPLDPNGVEAPPSAGPYYAAKRVIGRFIVLKRNPFYGGTRPRHLGEIDFTVGTDPSASFLQVQKGEADYDAGGLSPSASSELARKYGVNKSRYFVHTGPVVVYIALNASRRVFRSVSLRKAVNFALDRKALIAASGPHVGAATDQLIPPTVPGFRDERIYPLGGPDIARAKRFAGGRRQNAVLYAPDDPVSSGQAQVVQANLNSIGIDVKIEQFPFAVFGEQAGKRDAPFDLILTGWYANYPDPADFVVSLLHGRNIRDDHNQNLAHFDNREFNRKMDAAARLRGEARYRAYGALDAEIMRKAAPVAPLFNGNVREFVSKRVGCYLFQPAIGSMDLAAACLK